MKKLLQRGKLAEIESITKNKPVSNGMIIGSRANGKVSLQNLEFHPEHAFKVSYDPIEGEMTIRVKMNEGDFLALHDCKGIKEVKQV